MFKKTREVSLILITLLLIPLSMVGAKKRDSGAYKVKDKWIVSLDVSAPIDNEINGGIGVENNYKLSNNVNVAWRIGYNTKTIDVGGLGGYSLGLGGNFKRYRVDYAFVPFDDLGDTHRVSIGISF